MNLKDLLESLKDTVAMLEDFLEKNHSENAKEHDCLVAGIAHVPYEVNGKTEKEDMKCVGKFCYIEQKQKKANTPYFKGVLFDMNNNEQGSCTWNENEFYSFVDTYTKLF